MKTTIRFCLVALPIYAYFLLLYASVLISVCVHVYVYEQDPSSEQRFHVELHFSPGVKSCRDDENAPMGFGFRPASSEVCQYVTMHQEYDNFS